MQRKSNSSLAQGRTAKLRPYPHVSVLVWKRNFFSPFSKKFASTRSVFWSFTPVHTFTMNRLKTTTYPTAHAWPIRVKGQETLNKFLILRGVDSGTYSVTSALFSSVLTCTRKQRFREVPFSLIVFIGYVWREAVSVKKRSRFQMKRDTCFVFLVRDKQMRFIVQYTEVWVLTCSNNVPGVDMNFISV